MDTRNLELLKDSEMTELEQRGIALTRQATAEGSVLLENNGVLPLSPCRVALFGFGARQTINTGVGSGDVSPRYVINVDEGLRHAGFSVVTDKWLDEFDEIYRKHRDELRKELMEESDRTGIDCIHVLYSRPHEHIACQQITESDMPDAEAAIYVLSRKEGEGCDNIYAAGGYLPTEWELDHLRTLRTHYQKLILLLNIGSVFDMQEVLKIAPDAVLVMYQGGAEIGDAVADMITGVVPPSGKLTTTWAKDYWDYSNSKDFGRNCESLMVFYREGLYMGYRYFDSFDVKPQYSFGYGKTYTDFEITAKEITVTGSEVEIKVLVSNVGTFRGKEVVQAYLSFPKGRLDHPYQQLCAYVKTEMLEPGSLQELSIWFDLQDQSAYDTDKAAYLLEQGDYLVRLGNSSTDSHICCILNLSEECIIREVENVFHNPASFEDMKSDPKKFRTYPEEETERGDVLQFVISPKMIRKREKAKYSQEASNYLGGRINPEEVNLTTGETIRVDVPEGVSLPGVKSGEYTMEQLIASMDEEELIHLTTGQLYEHPVYRMKCYSPHVLGACGETTNYFEETNSPKEIPHLVTADGGSGLRLIRRFQTDENGEIIYLDPVLAAENGEFGMLDYREGLQDYYQYATALPISTQLACTWNAELLQEIGDQVGAEMERFGVNFWLAPGINLHRNPLGGRNFEYYSEDPYQSAMTAVALIKGVQGHPGKGTIVKHAAANNQETNRTSHIVCASERTMRELYLRAFELTVKYADPLGLMASLNCVNGPHATNSRELVTYIIQDEWNYQGLVVTDWNTTRKDRGANTSLCIAAGIHVIMPGSNRDMDNLRSALHNQSGEGEVVQLGELQKSAMGYLKVLARMME